MRTFVISVAASDLLPFRHLETLEIRGSSGGQPNLNFLMDEPLAMIKHVNFESIQLLGDEQMKKRMPLSQHPSETYDYVPESERIFYNVSLEMKEEEEVQIVSYDVYRMEQLKSKQPTFYGWANLHVLRIHQCQFDQVHWEMFDGLEKLQHLSLEHNDIKIVPPFAFYGALNIRSLSLAHNSILDMNYRALAGLLELETLDLSNNNLTKLSEMSFPPFPHLAKVDLRHNPIRYIFPMTFGVMNTTKQMTIGSDAMALDLTIGSSFGALEMLEFLTLRNVSIPTLSEWVFRGLHGIRTLRMSGHVRRIEFDAFAEMSALRELVLSHCGIVEISMDAFYGVRHLEVVDLSHNQLVAIPHGLFDEQRQLKEIYLQRNRLTMLPARFFDLPSIKLVRLIENPWMCSCEMRTWRQAITNRVRGKRLPAQRVCSDNAKTGFETCVEAESPRYSYEFDNKMSPRCDGGPEDFRYRSVYYTMRHSIKCLEVAVARHATKVERSGARFASDPETSHRMDKMRIKKKYEMTVDAIRSQAVAKSGVVMRMHRRPQRINPKSQQKLAIQNKLREMYQRDKLRQQEISNNIDL